MDLNTIQTRLTAAFAEAEHRLIIFWYDEAADFAEDIPTLTIPNAKIHTLSGKNYFQTKLLLEHQDPQTNYLIYAPFKCPQDTENSLADILHYSRRFSADRITLICQDLGIPHERKPIVETYAKFWNNKERLARFHAICPNPSTADEISLGILAVLTGAKHPKLPTILKKIITTYIDEKLPIIDELKKYRVDQYFWQACTKEYGFHAENPSLDKLIRTLFVTDLLQHLPINEKQYPKSWASYIAPHLQNIHNIIKEIRTNTECTKTYDNLATELAAQLRIETVLQDLPAEDCIKCDTFEYFDQKIIKYLHETLTQNQSLPTHAQGLITERLTSHYTLTYLPIYQALDAANQLLLLASEYQTAPPSVKTPEELFTNYQKNWYHIDGAYRHFYLNYDRIVEPDTYPDLENLVEQIYSRWINDLTLRWSTLLANNAPKLSDLHLSRQENFYHEHIEPELRRNILIVIISDALRYECGAELLQQLKGTKKYSGILRGMLATIPTYTELGMAALLPHTTITLTPEADYEVRIDGMPTNGLVNRQKILTRHCQTAAAYTYEQIIDMKREDIRKQLEGKTLIYIYHNKIDARGDNHPTEKQVFAACRETFDDIERLINKLTRDKSITNYLITADHGFLYERGTVTEADKINVCKLGENQPSYHKRRYLYGTQKTATQNTLEYSLEYLGSETAGIYAAVPKATGIFKKEGSGQNYVHGGYSLQEACIPLLKIKSIKEKVEVEKTSLALLSSRRKITNTTERLEFIQTQPCSETVQPLTAELWFESEDREKITTSDIIITVNEQTPHTVYREKFTFRKTQYPKNKKYYLIIRDKDTDTEISRYDYTIDIAFGTEEFGFGV